MGEVQAGANHLVSCVFGFFAVFGDVISQAAQTFLPGTVSTDLDLGSIPLQRQDHLLQLVHSMRHQGCVIELIVAFAVYRSARHLRHSVGIGWMC